VLVFCQTEGPAASCSFEEVLVLCQTEGPAASCSFEEVLVILDFILATRDHFLTAE
jgi:hypothetical protein